MTDSKETQAQPESGETPGEFLQHERERKGLSVQQAAENLHLDTWVIDAIETNKFSALGAPVYAKGHLRKYAALLGIPEDQLLDRYKTIQDMPAAPTLVPEQYGAVQPEKRGRRTAVILGWLVFAALLIMAAWAVLQ